MTLPDEVRSLLERAASAVGMYGDSLTGRALPDAGAEMLDLERDLRTLLAAQPEPQGVGLEVVEFQCFNIYNHWAATSENEFGMLEAQGRRVRKLCDLTAAQHLLSTERAEAERKMAEKDAEIERLSGDLAVALKVPSVAAMHSFLDTECAKQNVKLAAERDQLRARVAELEARQVVMPEGYALTRETAVEMPDGSKELGYTLLARLGVFDSSDEVIDAIRQLSLPLGWVSIRVDQLLPGRINCAKPQANSQEGEK